ncbi:MAG: OmpA family protein [Neomegalonema sp.]|nr:OmpA family protein [Neomegalonema sp.]
MRKSELISLVALALIGVIALIMGRFGARAMQDSVIERARDNLAIIGFSDIEVSADGLVVEIAGKVRSSNDHDVVLGTIQNMTGVARIVDNVFVVEPLMDGTPLKLVLQRDGQAVTLTGEAPNFESRDLLAAQAELLRGEAEFLNLMKAQDRGSAPDWFIAAEATIDAVSALRVGRGEVFENKVVIVGAAIDGAARDEILAMLQARLPSKYTQELEISAPPPLLSPYVFSARMNADGIDIGRCAVPDARLRSVVAGAVKSAGRKLVDERAQTCVIAHGAPNEQWSDAVVRSIEAMTTLQEGAVRIVDDQVLIEGFVAKGADITAATERVMEGWPAPYHVQTSIREILPFVRPYSLTAIKRPSEVSLRGHAPHESRVETWGKILGVEPDLKLARGEPPEWEMAVEIGLERLASLKIGALTVVGRSLILAAPGDLAERKQMELGLRGRLPSGYAVEVIAADEPQFLGASTETAEALENLPVTDHRPVFIVSHQDGQPALVRGVVADPASRATVSAYAHAKFGRMADLSALEVRPQADLPLGWQRALFASLDALSVLSQGEVMVEPGAAYLRGQVSKATQAHEALRTLESKLPEEFARFSRLRVEEVIALPEADGPEHLTDGACEARIKQLTAANPINFESGSSVISGDSYDVLERISRVLIRCPEAQFIVGGHTDASGSEEDNLSLSQKRAGQVRVALVRRGVDPGQLMAQGFGESRPIASNETASGRARNRRIEFKISR